MSVHNLKLTLLVEVNNKRLHVYECTITRLVILSSLYYWSMRIKTNEFPSNNKK